MNKVEFQRFTDTDFLGLIGREVLEEFFERFRGELTAEGRSLPAVNLADDAYLRGLAALVAAPGRLPRGLTEALLAVVDLARPEGFDQLREAALRAGLGVAFDATAPAEQFCFRVAVASERLFMAEYMKLGSDQLWGLDNYEGAAPEGAELGEWSPCRPVSQLVAALAAAVREWFEVAGSGVERPQVQRWQDEEGVELLRVDPGAHWPTERIGALWSPGYWARWDTIICSPGSSEVQIAAHHPRLGEIYREVLSRWIGGRADYLSSSPFRSVALIQTERADALDTRGVPGIEAITVPAWEVDSGNGNHETTTVHGDDLLRRGPAAGTRPSFLDLPGRLRHIGLLVKFADSRRWRRSEIWSPNHLKLESLSDAPLLVQWLRRLEIRKAA